MIGPLSMQRGLRIRPRPPPKRPTGKESRCIDTQKLQIVSAGLYKRWHLPLKQRLPAIASAICGFCVAGAGRICTNVQITWSCQQRRSAAKTYPAAWPLIGEAWFKEALPTRPWEISADTGELNLELRVVEERGHLAALNPSLLKAIASRILKMPFRVHHTLRLLALVFAGFTLAGCSSVNERIGAGVGDALPQWAGGLPPDVPPRRGTPEYEEYMKERERRRLEPATNNANAAAPGSAQPASAKSAQPLDPVH